MTALVTLRKYVKSTFIYVKLYSFEGLYVLNGPAEENKQVIKVKERMTFSYLKVIGNILLKSIGMEIKFIKAS